MPPVHLPMCRQKTMNSRNSKGNVVTGATGLNPASAYSRSCPAEPSLVSRAAAHHRPECVSTDKVVAEFGLVCYAAILKPQLINTDRLSDCPGDTQLLSSSPVTSLPSAPSLPSGWGLGYRSWMVLGRTQNPGLRLGGEKGRNSWPFLMMQ